ncbi:class I SAM-dependent methyltransferase [Streptomyces sp. NPDC014006]|uniref:class I SAM-dependent methyltransferase n=1 Tax=Streptomyces sp. NPDC014006 TaxID=3364870 RepID=UPI0036FE89F2
MERLRGQSLGCPPRPLGRRERRLQPAPARRRGHRARRPRSHIGCGAGATTRLAAGAAPHGSALGLDLYGPMLERARAGAGSAGLGNVRFEQGDAQVHPLPRGTFDLAISRFGIMFFTDPGAAFANIAAALRPGGRVALLCAAEPEGNQADRPGHPPRPSAAGRLRQARRTRHVLTGRARRGGRAVERGRTAERTGRTRHGLRHLGTRRGRGRRLPPELGGRPPPPHADRPRHRHPPPASPPVPWIA